MKLAFAAAALALISVPAVAQVAHQTSVDHMGQTVAVTYEPRVEYNLRQHGLGRPGLASCLGTARIRVQRTAVGPDGQPIAALTRVVEGTKARTSQRIGHCASFTEKDKSGFAGSEAALRSHVQAVASSDAAGLRAELTSLAALGTGTAHAR